MPGLKGEKVRSRRGDTGLGWEWEALFERDTEPQGCWTFSRDLLFVHSQSLSSARVTPVKCAQHCLKASRTLWGSLESQDPRGSQAILHQPR